MTSSKKLGRKPLGRKEPLNLKISPDLMSQLRERASQEERTLSATLERVLRDGLEKAVKK